MPPLPSTFQKTLPPRGLRPSPGLTKLRSACFCLSFQCRDLTELYSEPFSLYLYNEEFNDSFAIANNVDPALGSITIQIPVVPVRFVKSCSPPCSQADNENRDGYTLRAVNVGNIEDVYSSTGSFSVGAATQSIPTTPASTRTSSSGTGTSTRPASATTTSASTT